MADEQADDQGLLVDELEMSNQVSGQENNYHNINLVTLVVCYNKNKLVPMKCR